MVSLSLLPRINSLNNPSILHLLFMSPMRFFKTITWACVSSYNGSPEENYFHLRSFTLYFQAPPPHPTPLQFRAAYVLSPLRPSQLRSRPLASTFGLIWGNGGPRMGMGAMQAKVFANKQRVCVVGAAEFPDKEASFSTPAPFFFLRVKKPGGAGEPPPCKRGD